MNYRRSFGAARFAAVWSWAWLLLCSHAALAAAVAVPKLVGPLVDEAQIAGAQSRAISTALTRLHQDTGVQWVVLTVPTLDGEPIATFAHRVMEDWGLGQAGTDLGMLLLIVPQDRQTRLEVGYGLEAVVPDAVAKRLLADVLAPDASGPGAAPAAQPQITGDNLVRAVSYADGLIRQQYAQGLLPKMTPAKSDDAQALSGTAFFMVLAALVFAFVLTRKLMATLPKDHETQGHGRPGFARRSVGWGFWDLLVQLILAIISGGRGGPPQSGGGGYSGGGGRSGGGGASDRY